MNMYPTLYDQHCLYVVKYDSLGESIDFGMVTLEDTNDIVRPSSNDSHDDNERKSWPESKGVKDRRDTQYTQPDLGLGFEYSCSDPGHINKWPRLRNDYSPSKISIVGSVCTHVTPDCIHSDIRLWHLAINCRSAMFLYIHRVRGGR